MAMHTKKMTFPTEDEDDLDVEALRLAALQTLKKSTAPAVQNQSTSTIVNNASNTNSVGFTPRGQLLNVGRGRGVMGMGAMRRGMHRGRGGFTRNYFPNRPVVNNAIRPAGNSNLITIVPTVPDEPKPGSHLGDDSMENVVADSTDQEKVPAKFSRFDDNSDSEESDDDPEVKAESDIESSEEEDNEKDNEKSDPESEKGTDLVSLQPEEDEDEDSLERLMQELEDEISDTPKDKIPVVSAPAKEKPKILKVPRVKKVKKEKKKKEKSVKEVAVVEEGFSNISSCDVPDGLSSEQADLQSYSTPHKRGSRSPTPEHTSRTRSRSPYKYQPVARNSTSGRCKSPQTASPTNSTAVPKSITSLRSVSPHLARSPPRLRSPRRSRSPLRSRSPRRSRSPVMSRSPRRSRSRSPRRSPPSYHYSTSTRSPNYLVRSGSRSPYKSPRRSPHYLPGRPGSPSRLHSQRSRSRSPRPRSRSPFRVGYVRRSRSRTPLGSLRQAPLPGRRLSPYRRSRSRSPGGRLYAPRRSRSISPRGPRRSPSPRSRRSPLYTKKLSPKRRSISPRRRSISPRRRTPSPRRRSASPRRRSISPRRRPGSPGWNRQSPPRSRSPIGSFGQRPLSPRRRSPYVEPYLTRRSPSPAARKYSPLGNHRAGPGSPSRGYRSPSPVSRSSMRKRSPPPVVGSSHHRAISPLLKPGRNGGSPGRVREKQKQLSPLPASRNTNRLPSPRRQRSPIPSSRGYHGSKAVSPSRRVSPVGHVMKKSISPPRDTVTPSSTRDMSYDSISLSPSPERQPAPKSFDDRNRGRKSHPLGESLSDSKRSQSDLRSVMPRRKDIAKDSDNFSVHSDERSKKERKEKKKERKKERERQKRAGQQGSTNVLEARRRKFESGGSVEVTSKRIRLRNNAPLHDEIKEQEEDTEEMEVNIEKEKERELKEVNEVDESILDRELMGGVDLLWSDEEEEEYEEEAAVPENVQFKRTFNAPSAGSNTGKENIPDDSNDSKKDEEEEPTSTTASPLGIHLRVDESDTEDFEAGSESSGKVDDQPDEKRRQEAWPKTNRELKEYILSQAKGSGAAVRVTKSVVKESRRITKSNESDVDLRAELSRRRAERLTKVNSCVESLPGRLLASALQGVGVKSRREKSHRRRARSPPSFEDDIDQQENDGRRVLVFRRAAEQKEPAINITISKGDSSKESSSMKIGGKLPIHMRLGTGKKSDDCPKKVKLKRNITVGRKKQNSHHTEKSFGDGVNDSIRVNVTLIWERLSMVKN